MVTFQVEMSVITAPYAALMSARSPGAGPWDGTGLLNYRFVPPVQAAYPQPAPYDEQAQRARRDRLVGFGVPAHVLTLQEREAACLSAAVWGFPAAGPGADEVCGRALEQVARERILPLATELAESRDRLRAEARLPRQLRQVESAPGQSCTARRELLVVLDSAPAAEVERLLADVEEYSPEDQFIAWARQHLAARGHASQG